MIENVLMILYDVLREVFEVVVKCCEGWICLKSFVVKNIFGVFNVYNFKVGLVLVLVDLLCGWKDEIVEVGLDF